VLQTYRVDAVVAVPFLENDLIDATLMMAYGHLQKPYLEGADDGLDATLAAYRMMRRALCDERGFSSTPRPAQVPRSSKGG
jgi:hypothetical protein